MTSAPNRLQRLLPTFFCLALLGCVSFCSLALGQENPRVVPVASLPDSASRSTHPAARSSASPPVKNQIRLPVWVEQEESILWAGGQSKDFQVFLNDQETPIRSFLSPESPSILLIVLDTIADLARVEEARSALTEMLDRLPKSSWIGLLRTQNGLSVLQEPTGDRRVVAEKIRTVPLGGKAGLLDVLELVCTIATEIQSKARVRIQTLYITDGSIGDYRADYLNPVINASDSGDLSRRFSDRAVRERMDRQAETLHRFTIPISIVHLQYFSDSLNLAYMSGLEKLTANTGGKAAFCRSIEEIKPTIEKAIQRFQAGYQLVVDEPAHLPQVIKVRIDWKNPEGTENRRIVFPENIFPRIAGKKNTKS